MGKKSLESGKSTQKRKSNMLLLGIFNICTLLLQRFENKNVGKI